ncbi:MAG: protein kinase domain-containing protein [Acidimicrobiales bacterium]
MPLISDSIGRVLGNRYRLIAALGSGASAHVYLAEDVTLRRPVAVKVLQPALARDESFLRRFRAEARSVAALNHPHVLAVFDWGEDADGPYLVLEHLGGGSLRDMLDRGSRLDHAQAARVGAQVAGALAYAHARGLVHRDVKPANLLFDDEGRVRVADFGVARALAEAASTEPSGAMVGTARYASPEQAEGRRVDGRADVYALALVLYEAVTGEVPFVADTTTATLRARIGAPLPHHPALGPLDDVLARAAAPDPEARLDAAALVARLDAVGAGLPAPAPLPLVREPAAGPRPAAGFRAADEGTAMFMPAVGSEPPPTGEVVPPTGRRRRRRWPWAVLALVVVLAAAAVAVAVVTKAFTPSHPVPSMTGKTLAAARTAAGVDHFHLSVGRPVHSVTVAAGDVVHQRPGAGSWLKEGSTVTVVPSEGPPSVVVPSLSGGIGCAVAERLLAEAHLKATCPALLAFTTAGTVAAGDVINWSYGGKLDPTSAPYGSTVAIAISKGRQPVPVPPLTGDTFTQASAALSKVGLKAAGGPQQFSTTVPVGQVVSTTPATGAAAPYGSTVQVTVSKGPQTVAVPDVTGDPVPKATVALGKFGLTAGPVYGPPDGKVFTSVPLAGQQVKEGTTVTLYTQ